MSSSIFSSYLCPKPPDTMGEQTKGVFKYLSIIYVEETSGKCIVEFMLNLFSCFLLQICWHYFFIYVICATRSIVLIFCEKGKAILTWERIYQLHNFTENPGQ